MQALGGEWRRPRGAGRRCRGRVGRITGTEGEIAQRARFDTWTDAELVVEDPGQHFELPQHAGAVAGSEHAAHHGHMPILVRGIERDELVEPLAPTEELTVAQLKPLAVVERPVLVRIVGQQLARVDGEGAFDRIDVAPRQTGHRQVLEDDGIDVEVGGGKERHGVGAEHDAVPHTSGLADEVGGLVQPVGRRIQGGVRPEGVDHLFAVHPVPVGQGEELDESARIAPAEAARLDQAPVDTDVKSSEQPDLHAHRDKYMNSPDAVRLWRHCGFLDRHGPGAAADGQGPGGSPPSSGARG